ncbi:LYR motif-containing protein 2-like [Gigantopelta aegis]|uniref:LYR motif-containing protein 2-like n=1 Tax=Gigantopelta aegis TaxID=1735272 RepID=UPI001B887C10|nr:LYR motif-containing protein 2-like [Gigantopelta aegis]
MSAGKFRSMSLKRFIRRSEVLKLYRDILRTLKQVSNEEYRQELKKWARRDFENSRHQDDEEAIKMLLTKGRMQLKELTRTLQLSR